MSKSQKEDEVKVKVSKTKRKFRLSVSSLFNGKNIWRSRKVHGDRCTVRPLKMAVLLFSAQPLLGQAMPHSHDSPILLIIALGPYNWRAHLTSIPL